jgi:hypothetical protein
MNNTSCKNQMNPKTKTIIIIIGLIIIGIITGYIISIISLQTIFTELDKLTIQIDPIRINRSVLFYTGALICVAVEIVLLFGLQYMYFDSYRTTKSRFLIVLNIFIVALFIKSILSIISLNNTATEYIKVSPFVSRTFLTPGFNELNFIVYTFEIIALCILLYISME